MRVVLVSDTHLVPPAVPDGDVLIHAGDLTMGGTAAEIARAGEWLRALPHPHKVVIAGNHDFLFEEDRAAAERALGEGFVYLQDEEATVAGLRIWGSPWTPWFFDWAFNLQRGSEIRARWDPIPAGLDVLVTHGPALGILDRTYAGQSAGCADLLEAIQRVRPRFHVCGHIHEAYGRETHDGTTYVNASTGYRAENPAVVLDLG